jgi:hypothetical protein
MIVHVALERSKVRVRALAGNEAQLHQLARGVIDEDQQRTGLASLLKPAVITSVDLDQLAIALTPEAWLVECPALLARKPDAFLQHPCPQGLAANLDVMLGEQDFGSQRRPEIRILGPD